MRRELLLALKEFPHPERDLGLDPGEQSKDAQCKSSAPAERLHSYPDPLLVGSSCGPGSGARQSGSLMRRRAFIAGAAAAALVGRDARAQQKVMPVIGYLSQRSPVDSASIVAAFRQGLQEAGFVEGQNVAIEARFAEGQIDRLPGLARDLVGLGLNVFVATGGAGSVLKARPVVPDTIPIVFAMGGDPVKLGIVASLARPGDNITGVAFLLSDLAGKQVELLNELIPKEAVIGILVDPSDPVTESDIKSAQAAATALGHRLVIANASTAGEIAPAFTAFGQQGIAALFVNADPLFVVNFPQILELAAHQALPTISSWEGFAGNGGLISYGTSIDEANRLLGVYTGRVLKGEKPSSLPVQQSTKFKLVVNLKTAKALSLTIPPPLLARADEVIE
jgi:putative ABC transport system substrate-binding protein